jgi:16S rRNA (guanine527-N7)-methyltransferase
VEPELERLLRAGVSSLVRAMASGDNAARLAALDDGMVNAFSRYLDLLLLWNRRVNLSAVRDPAGIIEKHFVDSLATLSHIPEEARTLVDVGSGAGFPGAVIALARPDLSVTLVESIHKKTAFLEAVRRELALHNLTVQSRRIEELELAVDVAVSRATWDVNDWLRLGATLVHPGGTVLGMEGSASHALPEGASRHPYPLGSATRAIVVLRVPRST